MKKISEVFELPLAGEENRGEPFLSDENYYFASFDDELSYEDGKGLERARHAAHAINNVDALADALAYALDVLAHCKADAGYSSRQTKAAIAGDEALKAYRGEK